MLARSADIFVDSSVSLANRFRIPKLVIGIVLVSLATTSPELAVSLMAALQGAPQMALGNAIGSVICNIGLGLALCAVLSAERVRVIPHVLNASGGFMLAVSAAAFAFVATGYVLVRWEGVVLVAMFCGYITFLFRQHQTGRFQDDFDVETTKPALHVSLGPLLLLFAVGLAGIVLSSRLVIVSATSIARAFGIPEAVIALTLVALGTSIPEIATCVSAARKGEGALAVGNILGANIMNICWVAGFSSIANDLALSRREMLFMFPAMFVMLGVSFSLLRTGYYLTRSQGFILFALYVVYLAGFLVVFLLS